MYSTYLGGSGDDQAFGIAVEGTGTVAGTGGVNSSCSASCTAYVTGFTPSGNFPTVPTSSGKCAALQCAPAGSGVTNAFVTAIAPGGQSLTYSTYLGGTGGPGGGENATGAAIAVDTHGDAYVTGGTYSQDFPTCPTTNPNTSSSVTPDACATTTGTTLQTAPNPNGSLAYVSKLNATGTALIYSTYLGGTGTEQFSNGGTGITVDANGEAFVVGSEASLNFPTCPTPNPINDPNVSAPPSDACDTSNTTTTLQTLLSVPYTVDNSTNPPAIVSSSCHLFCSPDVFVAELTPDGSKLIYSTYLGGGEDNSFGGSTDTGDSVVVRGTGGADTTCAASCDAYITGYTYADDFPTCPDQNPNTPSTGTPPPDACDSSNKGSTLQAADKTGESGTGFVSELNPTGSQLVYSTYLGGSTSDYATGIGVDNSGDAYVFGDTESTDFPICANTTPTDPCASNAATPPQPSFGGGTFDAFVSELAPSGSNLVYSTYLGGSGDEETNGVGGNNLAVDASGNAYVTGMTTSTDFPTCPTQHSAGQAATCTSSTPTVTCTTTPLSLGAGGTLQCSNAGGQDAFVSKLASSSPTAVRVVSFGAQRQGADVVFHWRLAMTSGIAGFNLYARHHRLTPHTIPLRVSRNYRYTIRWKGHGPYSLSVLLKSGQSFTVTT